MDELCATCLSKHRTLVPLSTIEVNSSLGETIPFTQSPVLVCWECKSRLQNMQAFKAQATKAQELLQLYVENKKPLKALRCLSRLSISGTKTNYDENFVYCMKQETMECEEEYLDDFESDVKYDTEVIEHKPKTEINIDIQESYHSESLDIIDNYIQGSLNPSKSLWVTVEPPTESKDGDEYDSDEWPLSEHTKEKDCKDESNIKTEPKNNEIELRKDEDNFDIRIMSFAEMHRLRDKDRKNTRYISCPFKCKSCITGYYAEERYNAHVLLKHSEDNGPHTCDICLSRHKRPSQLARHRQSHLRRYHCRLCQFTARKHHLMLAHQSEHRAEKYTCEFCGFATLKSRTLRYHVNKMHKKPPRCEKCLKDFASECSYRNHMRAKHGSGAAKRAKCGVCGGMYRNLHAHVATHAPRAPDAFCVECGVGFKNKYTLKKHLLENSKHTQQNDPEVKWLVCDECDRRFTNKTSLERHIASQHTKQYPYNCDICQKGFARRDRLKYHMLERHEGGQRPRDHVCSFCGKAFKKKETLVNHIRTHTGERPFKCPHCSWTFAQRVTLRTHMRGKHPGADTGNTGGAGSNSYFGGNAE